MSELFESRLLSDSASRVIPADDSARYPASATLKCASGFVPRNETFHRIYNFTMGVLLLLLTAPVFVVISLLLLVTQGPNIIYAGERLGRHRKSFKIYKFRTLDAQAAADVTRDRVLPEGANIETPMGKFLRATRLDELPQLFNIIKGDMNLIGPRPVRPALAARQEAENPHYKVRYSVRPGLIGHTQGYMDHGTAKRLRSKMNYVLCRSRVNYFNELVIVVRVAYEVFAKSVSLILAQMFPGLERRKNARLARDWDLRLIGAAAHDVKSFDGHTVVLEDGYHSGPADLVITTRSGGKRKARVEVTPEPGGSGTHTVTPANDVARHYVSRYLLGNPVVSPRPARRPDRARQSFDKETTTIADCGVSGPVG